MKKYLLGAAAVLLSTSAATMARSDEAKTDTAAKPAGPVVEGHKFVAPHNALPKPNTREAQKTVEMLTTSQAVEAGSPDAKAGAPQGVAKAKERGSQIYPGFSTGVTYYGLPGIFQYTNDGAQDKNRACGQAAVATILTYYGIKPKDTGYSVIREIYSRYSPDIAFGILGTSWQQIGRALNGYGVPYNWYSGEAGLKNALNQSKPCIIMLDVGAIPEEGWGWGGHWVVAYGYDAYNIYLTNWNGNPQGYADGGKCTWTAFRKAWNAQLARANGTANMFICPKG